MIDPLYLTGPLQRPVLQLGPKPAHLLDLGPASFRGIKNTSLGCEPLRFQLAGGSQNVSMMIALIAFAVRRMDRHINCHAVATDQLLGKLAGEANPPGS